MMALPLPPRELVRAMRKEQYRNTKAGMARRLYAERCSPVEIALAMHWNVQYVRNALRRPA